jgi:hypothetical protein
LEKDSAQRKGRFALYNCLVLGHTKYNGVQRVYCNQFPAKPLYGPNYGSYRWDLVMIRNPGIAFVVTPDSVCYALVCSFSLPPHKPTPGPNRLTVLSCRRWKQMMILTMVIIDIIAITVIFVNISALLRLFSLLSIWGLLKLFRLFTLLHLFRLVGIDWFAS